MIRKIDICAIAVILLLGCFFALSGCEKRAENNYKPATAKVVTNPASADPKPDPPAAPAEQRICPEGATLIRGTGDNRLETAYCQKMDAEGNYVRDGVFVEWWENGQKRQMGFYCNGVQCGEWKYWRRSGVKMDETEILNLRNQEAMRQAFIKSGME